MTELYFPERVATSYILTRIATALAKQLPVHVITQQVRSGKGEPGVSGDVHIDRVTVHRCSGTHFSKDFLPGRIINALTRTAAMLVHGLLRCRRGDVVLVVTNPPTLPFAAAIIKLLKGVRLILLVHDVYPEVLIASGTFSSRSPVVRLWARAARWLDRRTSAIVCLGRDMKALVEARSGVGRHRVEIIPNWAELEYVSPQPRSQSRWLNQLGLQTKFVVLYAGTIGRTHGLVAIIHAAQRLQDKPDIHFLVAGFGAKEAWMRNEVARLHLGNVSVHGFTRPREEQGETLTACDVGLISFMPGMAGVSVPSRMYNFMAAGRPIIGVADESSELAQVVKEENIGWVVRPGDPAALVRAVLEAKSDSARLKEMGERAAKAARSKYTFEHALKAYHHLLDEGPVEGARDLTRPISTAASNRPIS